MEDRYNERDLPVTNSIIETARSLRMSSLKDPRLFNFLGDVVISFIYWSMFSEFIPTMWYIPMNLMRVSGIEPILFFPSFCLALTGMLNKHPKY